MQKNLSSDLLKKEEAKLFFNHIDKNDWVTILDEKGKQFYQQRIFSENRYLDEFFGKKNPYSDWRCLRIFR